MSSVEFATVAGIPHITRSTNPPSLTSLTVAFWLKCLNYLNYGEIFNIFGGGYLTYETDNTGVLYVNNNNATAPNYQIRNILTGSDTAWYYHVLTIDVPGQTVTMYKKLEGGTLSQAAQFPLTNFTPDGMQFGTWGAAVEGGDGTFRLCIPRIWNAVRTLPQLEAESKSLTPIVTSGLTWANDCQSAASVGTDQSSTGGDFTVFGTPTTSSDTPSDIVPPSPPAPPTIVLPPYPSMFFDSGF